jgi:MFS family permease
MLVCFALIPLAVSGLHLHFLAYLADMGVDAARAGAIASIGGAALVVARVLTGFLIDHLFAPYVAAAMIGFSALAIAGMGVLGADAAVLGAIAIGMSLGAELDLIGYMTARYFGLERFGRIYGMMYGAVLVGGAASPIVYGLIADRAGSYQAGLHAAAILLAASALLFLALPRFGDTAEH